MDSDAVDSDAEFTRRVRSARGARPHERGIMAALGEASYKYERVSFRYLDGKMRATDRVVEPHGLVNVDSRWYLVAWDLSRDDWRTFRVDRVKGDVNRIRETFTPRPIPGGDLTAYIAQTLHARRWEKWYEKPDGL